jgi:signal transduction histidine kinase
MSQTVLDLIQNCQWFPSHFLIVSQNVFSPLLYYSYFGAAVPVILLGVFVFLNGKNKLENKLLFLTIISFVIWIFCALVTWATEFPKYTMFFWAFMNIVEPFVYFFAFYFSFVFFFKKDFSIIQKILFSLPLLPSIIMASTKFMLLGYDLSNCDRGAVEGILSTYDYILEIVYAVAIIIIAIFAFKKIKDKISRKKILFVTIGITLFLLSFSLGNILEIFTDNWYIGQYGLFGAPIFMAFLAYIIVKFKAFDVKLIATQALVWASVILIGSEFFFIQSNINRLLTALTLITTSVIGLMIVRSVKKEIALREELEIANNNQTSLIHFISHQIKGFFTKSKMIFAGIVEEDFGEVSGAMKEAAKEGLKSDNNAVSMIQDILGASNLKKGTTTYNFQETDLSKIVKNITEDFKTELSTKGLELKVDIGNDPIFVNADDKQISQVIKNLIDNSIKYTPSGYIKVSLYKKVEDRTKVIFKVEDSGVGLSESDKKKLFTEGGKGEDSLKVNVNSTGYGLYIVKKIVDNHNGRIWAESEGRGKGSQFYVELALVK